MQISDWSNRSLTEAQIDYAANNVRYLLQLLDVLLSTAGSRGDVDLVLASYAYLPARVQLDLIGAGDVFAY